MALAQGLAARRPERPVVLADCCRRAQHAMLHDTVEVGPGVHELVDAHRLGTPTPTDSEAATFPVAARGYRLLLGLRRPRYWSSLRRRSFESALDGLTRTFSTVVADIDGDLEGESTSGSIDVEERNLMARTVVGAADVVVVVGRPGLKGLHSLAWLLHDLVDADVDGARILPVLNGVGRSPRLRAQLQAALQGVVADLPATIGPAVILPDRPVDAALRDGAPIPAPLPALLVGAYEAARSRVGAQRRPGSDPALVGVPVSPGSLGACFDGDGDDDGDAGVAGVGA
jgi:hypothetical protein